MVKLRPVGHHRLCIAEIFSFRLELMVPNPRPDLQTFKCPQNADDKNDLRNEEK